MTFPAARIFDPVTHDALVSSGLIVGEPPAESGFGLVLIEDLPAAHVGCLVMCDAKTVAGPAHPTLPPTLIPGAGGASAPGGPADSAGGSDSPDSSSNESGDNDTPPSQEADAQESDDEKKTLKLGPNQKEMQIRIVRGSMWGFSTPAAVGMARYSFDFKIRDVKADREANYSMSGWTLTLALDPEHIAIPISNADYHNGKWQSFPASRDATFEDFAQHAILNPGAIDVLPMLPKKSDFGKGQRERQSAEFGFGGLSDGSPYYGDPFHKISQMKHIIPDLDLGEIGKMLSTDLVSFQDHVRMDIVLESVKAPPPPIPGMTTIQLGSSTVFIHDQPAARWSPAADVGGCGVRLGDPKAIPTRTVLIGG